MRLLVAFTLIASCLAVVGCGNKPNFDGPTVEAFTGRVTQNGKAVSLPQGRDIQLKLWHTSGQSFGIPLDREGKFTIGWMPIGKYTVMVEAPPKGGKGPPMKQSV